MQKFKACKNRSLPIQRRRSTSSSCMIAICPAGPPKLMNPSFVQILKASRNGTPAGLTRDMGGTMTRATYRFRQRVGDRLTTPATNEGGVREHSSLDLGADRSHPGHRHRTNDLSV